MPQDVPTNSASDNIDTHLKRAWEAPTFEAARGELDSALSMLDLLSPEDREHIEVIVWINYATLAERFGDSATAVIYNQKLLANDPDDLSSAMSLLSVYRKLGVADLVAGSLQQAGILAERLGDEAALAVLATLGHLPADVSARAARLKQAIGLHVTWLSTEASDKASRRHARTQYGLGRLYVYRAEGLDGPERLDALNEAVRAYRAALDVYSADRFPTQHREIARRLSDAEGHLSAAT
jgi:tetratricopeptide (TPR) repeat protein